VTRNNSLLSKTIGKIGIPLKQPSIEMRVSLVVNDVFASEDSQRVYPFLKESRKKEDLSKTIYLLLLFQDRGLRLILLINMNLKVVPLTGVDMMEATVPGLIVWKTAVGENVRKDQLIVEIVDIEDVDSSNSED
jgi:hypothetical protein